MAWDKGVRISFGQRNVPDYILFELHVKSRLPLRFGVENMDCCIWRLRQQPEQRSVVLDGVGADDGEALHFAKTVSMAMASFFAASLA